MISTVSGSPLASMGRRLDRVAAREESSSDRAGTGSESLIDASRKFSHGESVGGSAASSMG